MIIWRLKSFQSSQDKDEKRNVEKKIEKVVFLDRDGVLIFSIREGDYVKNFKQIRIIDENVNLFKKLSIKHDVAFIVITNQAGVEKGLVTMEEVEAVNKHIDSIMSQNQIRIEAFYICPHKEESECGCRKPRPGLLENAIHDFSLTPSKCLMIGDRETDLLAGNAVGIRSFLLNQEMTFSERVAIARQINSFFEQPDYSSRSDAK